ncbi:beta-lactamase family protein [Aggregatimonas sangjinii]|uniref:Beta-lactamase family protein n=1 Tax=Aggregatimonas sangjinii TaxID=2583587 RepID=A0A5B7SNM0_9FLAO|nr:serine hydrolase domain-containing protein [Aggregatimonas sangjinii]QCW99008.1 beta-lactamase family protein [Aggregatimonas sangjinii]
MNPITKYLKNLFASKRVLGEDANLKGLAKAEALLQNLVNDNKVPGISISVLKKGETLLQKGYGYADMEAKIPVDIQKTIFRIASVSKPIAATALAHMVAEGRIDLDASFYDYVPYYPKKKWDFTIRQLASHTAGIRGYQGTEYGLNIPYSIKESIEIFKDDELLFEPGTDYLYNSYDWVLISLAMQEASGIPFEAYVKQKVLQPLGMEATFAPVCPAEPVEALSKVANSQLNVQQDKIKHRLTSFYSKNRSGFRKAIPVNNYYKLAGGGYLSTSADIARFGQAFLDGRILNEGLFEQFLTATTVNGKSTYYGLGWQVSEDKNGRPFYGHVGNGVGGYSNFFVYPEQQMVFAILVNCTNPDVQDTLDALVDCLLKTVENNYLGTSTT